MKNLKDIIKESNSPFNKDQNWEYWCLSVIEKLTEAFETYKSQHKDYNPEEDEFPENFTEDVIKIAEDKEFYDCLHCLYRCWFAGDYKRKDVNSIEKILKIK